MRKDEFSAHITVLIAGFSFGVVPIFSAFLREAQVSSIEQSFIRLLTGAIVGIILVLSFSNSQKQVFQKSFSLNLQKTFLAQGFLLSLSLNCFLASIVINTPVGEASLLTQIHPVITLFLGWILLKESITTKKIGSLLAAIIGITMLTQPWVWSSLLDSLFGDLLALSSGIAYGVYILLGKLFASKRQGLPSSLSIGWVLIWGFIMWLPFFLLVQTLPLPVELTSFDMFTYTSLYNVILGLGLGTLGNVVPFGLIMLSANRMSSFRTSILLLTEPISAIMLGAIILSENITIWYILGGIFLFLAVLIVLWHEKEQNERSESLTAILTSKENRRSFTKI